MNILILSCGTRNKLVEYFMEKGNGFDKVIVTDCSKYAPALYVADKYYIFPRMDSPEYLECILEVCRTEKVSAILPLLEDELAFVAKNKSTFLSKSILPIVSGYEVIELCRDKYDFFRHLKQHDFPVLKTFSSLEQFMQCYQRGEIDFPVFMKPVRGCGSVGICKINDMDLLNVLYNHSETAMLIQEFCRGEEFGADIYVDMISKEPVSIFVKRKIRMRAGETEKSVSVKDEKLCDLIVQAVHTLDLCGPIDMDIFKTGAEYYIMEINPRFGGGYPHAYSCGVNFPKMIFQNIAKKKNENSFNAYEADVYMMKYSEAIVKHIV